MAGVNRSQESGNDLKFELEVSDKCTVYAVVCVFHNDTYIHIRRYYHDKPSRFGVSFKVTQWFKFIEFMKDCAPGMKYKGETTECIVTKNNSLDFKSTKGGDFYITNHVVESLRERLVFYTSTL